MPGKDHADRPKAMQDRWISLLVFFGLFFGLVVAPVMAHASEHGARHASAMVDVHEINDVDHKHSQGSDKGIPCHAVSHHHCGIALSFDSSPIGLNRLSKAARLRPAAMMPFVSRSQAPPLDPPLA